MPPPLLQSVARKREGVRSSASTMAPGRQAGLARYARQRAEHAVANIAQIVGAGAEMLVIGGLIALDFGVERRAPGLIRACSFGDRLESRGCERFILQHGDLESEDGRAIVFGVRRELRELSDRRDDRVSKRRRFLIRLSASAAYWSEAGQNRNRSGGKATGRKPAGETKLTHARVRPRRPGDPPRPHGSRERPIREAPRAPGVRRAPWRENAGQSPSPPLPPSP